MLSEENPSSEDTHLKIIVTERTQKDQSTQIHINLQEHDDENNQTPSQVKITTITDGKQDSDLKVDPELQFLQQNSMEMPATK